MAVIITIIILGILFPVPCLPAPSDSIAEELHAQISRTIEHLVIRQEYESALITADSLVQAAPGQAFGYFLNATILYSRALDYEDDIDLPRFKNACERAESVCRQLIQIHGETAEYCFYLGALQVYKSLLDSRGEDKLQGLLKVLQAGSWFERAVRLDSSFWDAYLGLGSFYYYRSARAGWLRNIGIIPDRRAEGLKYIQLAAERGQLSAVAARSSLAWIAIDRKAYAEAIERASALHSEFPHCRSFMWCLARAHREARHWERAIYWSGVILEQVRASERNNHFNEISCLHTIALSHRELGQWEEAASACEAALSLSLDESTLKRKRNDLKRLREILAEARKHLD